MVGLHLEVSRLFLAGKKTSDTQVDILAGCGITCL